MPAGPLTAPSISPRSEAALSGLGDDDDDDDEDEESSTSFLANYGFHARGRWNFMLCHAMPVRSE